MFNYLPHRISHLPKTTPQNPCTPLYTDTGSGPSDRPLARWLRSCKISTSLNRLEPNVRPKTKKYKTNPPAFLAPPPKPYNRANRIPQSSIFEFCVTRAVGTPQAITLQHIEHNHHLKDLRHRRTPYAERSTLDDFASPHNPHPTTHNPPPTDPFPFSTARYILGEWPCVVRLT